MVKKLGILGGLGPLATSEFFRSVIEMTDAGTDQQHIETMIYSNPSIPDRTAYILGKSDENPYPKLLQTCRILKDMGADIIAMPCVTGSFFIEDLKEQAGIEVISIIKETVEILTAAGVKSVGIMATDGTLKSGLLQEALTEKNISVFLPSEQKQKTVMSIIYDNVKSYKPVNYDYFNSVSTELKNKGAEIIILGCTELSIVRRDSALGKDYLDVLQVLSRKSVLECGRLKKEYDSLI